MFKQKVYKGEDMKSRDEFSINLADFLKAVIHSWKMIIGGTFIAGVISIIIAFFILPEIYSTSATMLVTRNPLTSDYTPKTLSIPSMEPILTSDDILQKVMEKSGILEENEEITLTTFRRMLSIDIFIEQDTNVAKDYSPVIRLNAQGPSPEIARSIVDEWLIQSAERLNEVLGKDLAINIEIVEESYQENFNLLDELQKEILELDAEIPVIEKEIDYLVDKRTEFLENLRDMDIQIAKKEAILQEISKSYARETDILTLRRTITDDAFWQAIIDSDQRLSDILGAGLGNEMLNPVYMDLKKDMITERVALSGVQQERSSTEMSLQDTQEQIITLNAELNSKKLAREVLAKNKNLVEGRFKKYQETKKQLDIEERLASRMLEADEGQFRFVKAATWGVINPQRVSPQRTLIVMAVTFIAFWSFVVLAFILDLLKSLGITFNPRETQKSRE